MIVVVEEAEVLEATKQGIEIPTPEDVPVHLDLTATVDIHKVLESLKCLKTTSFLEILLSMSFPNCPLEGLHVHVGHSIYILYNFGTDQLVITTVWHL